MQRFGVRDFNMRGHVEVLSLPNVSNGQTSPCLLLELPRLIVQRSSGESPSTTAYNSSGAHPGSHFICQRLHDAIIKSRLASVSVSNWPITVILHSWFSHIQVSPLSTSSCSNKHHYTCMWSVTGPPTWPPNTPAIPVTPFEVWLRMSVAWGTPIWVATPARRPEPEK